jgi:beta-phosphoglucomutase-like phosphatase (HAD superfamily)
MTFGPRAVCFDLDGTIIASEELLHETRRNVTLEYGGRWTDDAVAAMMGMNTREWSEFMHDELGLPLPRERIVEEVERRITTRYRSGLPLIDGAVDAVRRCAELWPLALASGSTHKLIELVLRLSGLEPCFSVVASADDVARGKPSPDVYLRAAALLHVAPPDAVAVEDSRSGILSAADAGMAVIAVPNPTYPPPDEALARASKVLVTIRDLTPDVVRDAAKR